MAFKTRDLSYMAIAAALLTVCSWLSIPAAVPFTLQTFALFCALNLLGGRRGTIAVLVYLLLGAVGLPVFSGFRSGFGALFGPTGGFLTGFLLTGLVGWLFEQFPRHGLPVRIIAMLIGLLLCYAFGTAWFMVVYARTNGAITLSRALGLCVFPFIIPDLLKLAFAILLSERLKRHIPL